MSLDPQRRKNIRTRGRNIAMLLFALSVSSMGCQTRAVGEDQQFQKLFEGYKLVLVDDLQKGRSIEEVETSTLRSTYPLEPRLVPARVYVFRKTNQMANETIAMKVFPERLSSIRARVTKAPQSSNDLVYLIIGGPLFKIEFEKDGHQGKILNRVHTSEKASENWEELIVAYI